MGAVDVRERLLADSQFGGGALGAGSIFAPATWYLGLSTTVPNDDGTNFTEPVGGSYGRVAKTNDATNFPAAFTTAGVTTKWNGTAVTFVTPTAFWGIIIWYGWFTAVSGGVPQYVFALDNPIPVNNGNSPVEFAINQLRMTWD